MKVVSKPLRLENDLFFSLLFIISSLSLFFIIIILFTEKKVNQIIYIQPFKQVTVSSNFGSNLYSTYWFIQKFGFIKQVDKGWITTVKDLESWRFES